MKMFRKLLISALALTLPPLAVAQSCTLTPLTGQPNRAANLAWQVPNTTLTVGFNLYRCSGTCAQPAGIPAAPAWTKVQGSIPQNSPNWIDSTVTAGATYTYAVTAYDVSGANAESDASNVCTGTIPNPTNGGGNGKTPSPLNLSGTVQ